MTSTATDLGNYSRDDRFNEVVEQLNNSYAQFRKEKEIEGPQNSSSNVPKSSNKMTIPVQPDLGSIQLTTQLSTKSATYASKVKSNMERDYAGTKHIEDRKTKVFSGFVDKFNRAIAKETDLKKMEAEYLELEELMITEFNKLCKVRGSESIPEIEKAIEDLELKIQGHWEHCAKQHASDIARATSAVNTYERVFTEAVQAALTDYFVHAHPSSMYSLIERSKRKAEAAVETQYLGKFKAMFNQQIKAAMENVKKQAKIVKNLVSCFQDRMMTKISLFNCLSDREFTKYASEFKVIAVEGFSGFKDSEFHSFLENLLTSTSQKLEQRNRNIRRCEVKVAFDAIRNVMEFYEMEMQNFCKKKAHTAQVLEEFHNNLSRDAVEYFISACNFNPVSGICNEKFTSKIQSSLQELFNEYLHDHFFNSEKQARKLLNQSISSEAISEYNKIMGEQLNGRSVSEIQLILFHTNAVNHVLTVFKLKIQEVAVVSKCEEEVESLRNNIYQKYLPDWEKENADMRHREAEENAGRDRLLTEQEQARREKVARLQAEAQKRRQTKTKQYLFMDPYIANFHSFKRLQNEYAKWDAKWLREEALQQATSNIEAPPK